MVASTGVTSFPSSRLTHITSFSSTTSPLTFLSSLYRARSPSLPSSSSSCFSIRLPPCLAFISGGAPTSTAVITRRRGRRRCNGTRANASAAQPTKYVREDYLVRKVSTKELQELVKGERSVPLIVDFYATWCGPCILMAQDLEMLAVEYENEALFVKVDTDDEYEFAHDMQVRGLPTLYFFSPDPNKDAIRTEGLIPPEMIRKIIDNEL